MKVWEIICVFPSNCSISMMFSHIFHTISHVQMCLHYDNLPPIQHGCNYCERAYSLSICYTTYILFVIFSCRTVVIVAYSNILLYTYVLREGKDVEINIQYCGNFCYINMPSQTCQTCQNR